MWFIAQIMGLLLLPVISLAMFAFIICSLQWHKFKD